MPSEAIIGKAGKKWGAGGNRFDSGLQLSLALGFGLG
jgi:hypothetical protein